MHSQRALKTTEGGWPPRVLLSSRLAGASLRSAPPPSQGDGAESLPLHSVCYSTGRDETVLRFQSRLAVSSEAIKEALDNSWGGFDRMHTSLVALTRTQGRAFSFLFFSCHGNLNIHSFP